MGTHNDCCRNHSKGHSAAGLHNSESVTSHHSHHCSCGCGCNETHKHSNECGCIHDEPIPPVND